MNTKYTNEKIEKNIKDKWFSVYNYISINELLSTLQRDYLSILSKINTVFAILTIIIWYISFETNNFWLLLWFLLLLYWLIFLYLIIKLLSRLYSFLLISDIIYTHKWIILWNRLYDYKKDSKEIDLMLIRYEEDFDEYLSKESRISNVIATKKTTLTSKIIDDWWKILKESSDFWSESAKFMIIVFLLYILYWISLFIFYYIWYIIWFLIFLIFWWIIKLILFFRKNIEIKIKHKIEELDDSFIKMDKTYQLINKKVNNFKWWEISDISLFIWNNFNYFYSKILFVYNEKQKLFNIIEKSKYKEFIDFQLLQKYINSNFNKPVNDMISLLNKYEKILNNWINELAKNDLNWNFKKKELILQNQLNLLIANKWKLKKSLL